jgi:hypothetical protein
MFSNIGNKIKTFAIFLFVIEAIGAIFTGIALIAELYDEWIGVLVMFAGPVVAWISSWLLYGFGELIDKTCEIAENTRHYGAPSHFIAPRTVNQNSTLLQNNIPKATENNTDASAVSAEIRGADKICPKCGQVQKADRHVCWSCGQRFSN